jgi:hypothetical protein
MGFVNIGGQTVHTSSIGNPVFGTPSVSGTLTIGTGSSSTLIVSGTNSNITTSALSGGQYVTWGGSTMNYTINKITYHVLGEDIQVDGYGDPHLAVTISTLNVLGKPFYDELKKNNVSLPLEIEEYLELKFKILERDRKIKDILKP